MEIFVKKMAESKRERPTDDDDENPAPTKRADPDDLNEEQQDALLNNPKMLAFFAAWNLMNWDEKRLAYEGIMEQVPQNKPFMGLVPPDIQKMIAYSTAGTLMKLARVNKFFYALASDDHVWKRMFARDYPEDFAFCRGELPFFILTRDHPCICQGAFPNLKTCLGNAFI